MVRIILTAWFAIVGLGMAAQSVKDEFESFRNNIMGEYSGFRESVLSNYDSFLESVWTDFEVFAAKTKYEEPKPQKAPGVDNDIQPEEDTQIPIAEERPEPKLPSNGGKEKPSIPILPEDISLGKPPKVSSPSSPLPTTPLISENTPSKRFSFPFHGVEIEIEDVNFGLTTDPSKREDFAKAWRELRDNHKSAELVSAVKDMSDRYNLNDYLTFDAIMWYVTNRYPEYSIAKRFATVHYIMANLGYDIRIATDQAGKLLLLIPIEQMVFGRRSLSISGRSYYIFDSVPEIDPIISGTISSYSIPDNIDSGMGMDLIIRNLNLPEQNKEYDIAYGPLRIKGEFNANIIPLLYRYPQMTINGYASSEILPEVRKDITNQVKAQLDNMSKIDAVNALLRLTQSGFEYATDGELYGFEKPYFFEEMLFYPKCDCEDRVVFYTYLLWNALGIENHMLGYPGHESASVHIDGESLKGDYYIHDGKQFYISDPTYIGSKTGMCMPRYRSVSPIIDKEYKN